MTRHDGDVEPERFERTVALANEPACTVRDQRASPEPRVVVEPIDGLVLPGNLKVVDTCRRGGAGAVDRFDLQGYQAAMLFFDWMLVAVLEPSDRFVFRLVERLEDRRHGRAG